MQKAQIYIVRSSDSLQRLGSKDVKEACNSRSNYALDLHIGKLLVSLVSMAVKRVPTYLEESFEPPHLENTLANDYHELEHTPPLHTAVGALCSIPVNALTDYNV